MRKIHLIIAAALLLTSCGAAEGTPETAATVQTETFVKTLTQPPAETTIQQTEQPQTVSEEISELAPVPDNTITPISAWLKNSNTIRIDSSLDNVETVKIYGYDVSSESGGIVSESLIFDGTAEDISGGELSFDTGNIIESRTYEKDNSAVKTSYYAQGVRLVFANKEHEESSGFMGLNVGFETGVVNQYNAELEGETACGAANGTLLLQTVLPVRDYELTQRMSTVRSYSALGYDYSLMDDVRWCMSGTMVANSVNKYLSDNNIEGYKIVDVGENEKSTTELIVEGIDSGRPVAVMGAFYMGQIVDYDSGFGHWYTINAYELDENGVYNFRWENTLNNEEHWTDSETITASVNIFGKRSDMPPLEMPDGTKVKVGRFVDRLEEPVVDSFI